MYFEFEANAPQIDAFDHSRTALYAIVQRNVDHTFVNRMEITVPYYIQMFEGRYRQAILNNVYAAYEEAGPGCDMDEITHTDKFTAALDADIAKFSTAAAVA